MHMAGSGEGEQEPRKEASNPSASDKVEVMGHLYRIPWVSVSRLGKSRARSGLGVLEAMMPW